MGGTVIEMELGGDTMSTLKMEFMETIEGLSDDTMRILLEVVKQVVLPLDHKEKGNGSSEYESKLRRMGSLKGQRLIAEEYDIDECNDEIANMFGIEKRRVLGIANGKYSIPDNIDECNDEIAEMFGVN